jgi:hypothetical protein
MQSVGPGELDKAATYASTAMYTDVPYPEPSGEYGQSPGIDNANT